MPSNSNGVAGVAKSGEAKPRDPCDALFQSYLKCVKGKRSGLSEATGECLDEKMFYRKCVRAQIGKK